MLQIIFEDKDMIVINKPAGLVVHDDGKLSKPNKANMKIIQNTVIQKTLCDYLLEEYPEIKGVGEPLIIDQGPNKDKIIIDRPGIVHRLDKETSGVMLVAKNQKTFDFLKLQFQNHEIKKKYHAFVWGSFKEADLKNGKGKIERPIGRSKTDFRKWSAERFARGELRPAVTNYTVLKNFMSKEVGGKGGSNSGGKSKGNSGEGKGVDERFAFIEAEPLTGRTHQIRVHFKAINHPIVSDALYAGARKQALGFERQALHAHEISFQNLRGDIVTFTAPYPEDFATAVKKFVG